MRITRLRWVVASTAAEPPRRRRGLSPSNAIALGTFLPLMGLVVDARRLSEGCDVARRLIHRRGGEFNRQRNNNGGSLVDLAVHSHITAVQRNQALDDRQSEAGALVPALIGRAGLKERIADPLEILRPD